MAEIGRAEEYYEQESDFNTQNLGGIYSWD